MLCSVLQGWISPRSPATASQRRFVGGIKPFPSIHIDQNPLAWLIVGGRGRSLEQMGKELGRDGAVSVLGVPKQSKNPAQHRAGCPHLASCCWGILASIAGTLRLPLQQPSSPRAAPLGKAAALQELFPSSLQLVPQKANRRAVMGTRAGALGSRENPLQSLGLPLPFSVCQLGLSKRTAAALPSARTSFPFWRGNPCTTLCLDPHACPDVCEWLTHMVPDPEAPNSAVGMRLAPIYKLSAQQTCPAPWAGLVSA